MDQIKATQKAIIRMFDKASVSRRAKSNLITYLETLNAVAPNDLGGIVAETLIAKLGKSNPVSCSDKQAYVMARTAQAFYLLPEGYYDSVNYYSAY